MSALREPRFRRLLVGWSCSNFGDSALYLSLPIWVKDLTGSSGAAGLTFFFLGVPVFLSPFGGHLVDRVRRRSLLIGVNVAGALMVLSLLLVSSAAQIWLIYLVAFGYGLLGTLTGAAQSGLLRDLLPDEDLPGANASLSTIDQGLRLISPLVGAGVYAAVGGGALAVLAAATFGLATVGLLSVRITETDLRAEPRASLRHEFVAGFRHVRATPQLLRLVTGVAIAFAVLGLLDSVLFAVVDVGLGREPAFFGVLMSLQGGGSILGGLSATRLIRRFGEVHTVGTAFVLFGLSSALLVVPQVVVVASSSALAGVAIPWLIIGVVTARQRLTPPRLQGRVAAVTLLSMNGPQTVSIAAGAALVATVDYRLLIVLSAAVVTLAGGWLLQRTPDPAAAILDPPAAAPNPDPAGRATFDPAAGVL